MASSSGGAGFVVKPIHIAECAADLMRVGRRDLRLKLRRALREAAAPAVDEARSAAETELPRAGGLAARVAASRFSVSARTSGSKTGVSVKASNAYDIPAMDRGQLRHKVFGRNVWVTQDIRPGWFSDAVRSTAPLARARVGVALREIQHELHN